MTSTQTIATKQMLLLATARRQRANAIAIAGGLEEALRCGGIERRIDTTISEALVLGLIRQQVRTFLVVFGHGSTEIAEVLRIYEQAGVVHTHGVRHEIEAAHAAMTLRWVAGQKAAVVTSIGPGALQAMAGSLAAASDGVGVWHIYGDQTTQDEGPNMQQVPRAEQHLYLKLCATMGPAYCLHTPEALGTALRRGLNTVDHPHRAGPFYLLMPMNVQPSTLLQFNLDELPSGAPPSLGAASDDYKVYARATEALLQARKVVVKVGGGARRAGGELLTLLSLADAVAVTSPLVSGVIPFNHPRNMTVGGSKGSISGNYAMEEADLLVAIGTRFVCQSDCSRTGYPNVQQVININTDVHDATHYGKTIALLGDAGPTLIKLNNELRQHDLKCQDESPWLKACREKRRQWDTFRAQRYATPRLYDTMWSKQVLTQPAVIKAATDWARDNDVVTFFDAGNPQANGFQIVEDDRLGCTFTETGASYMGFAVSALLATGLLKKPFYGLAIVGDGSFTMNPQILIDGIQHNARGCILLLDNRRMAAISGLQTAQYKSDHATSDQVEIDYLAWARAIKGVAAFDAGDSTEQLLEALKQARRHEGLSLIYVPVYYGDNPLGGMGDFGRWNVGDWCQDTQRLRHEIGL